MIRIDINSTFEMRNKTFILKKKKELLLQSKISELSQAIKKKMSNECLNNDFIFMFI